MNNKKEIACDNPTVKRNTCELDCSTCSAYYLYEGNKHSEKGNCREAIKSYQKALALEPQNEYAWVAMAETYVQLSEYNNALYSYKNAFHADPWDQSTIMSAVDALVEVGQADLAMQLINANADILLDWSEEVNDAKDKLRSMGIRDTQNDLPANDAIDKIRKKAESVIKSSNCLLLRGQICAEEDPSEKKQFAESIISFCKKRFAAFDEDTVYRNAIIISFYGALYLGLIYNDYVPTLEDNHAVTEETPFEYLKSHVDLELVAEEVERILEIHTIENDPWDIINDYSQYAINTMNCVQPREGIDSCLFSATENAYILGMSYAYRKTIECDLHTSESEVVLAEKLNQIVFLSFHYQWGATVNFSTKDSSIVTCGWGNFIYGAQRDAYYEEHGDNHLDWDLVPLYIRGKNEGTTSIAVSVRDTKTKDVIEEETIFVKVVKGNNYSVHAIPSMISLRVFETQTVGIPYSFADPNIICSVDDLSIATVSIKEPVSGGMAFINVCGRDEGITNAIVRFCDKNNGAIIASTELIIVVGEERLTTDEGVGYSFDDDSSLSVDSRTVRLSMGESKTITCSYSSDVDIIIRFKVELSTIANCKWGPFSDTSSPLTITGKKQGKTKVFLYLLGPGDRILCALDFDVIVE